MIYLLDTCAFIRYAFSNEKPLGAFVEKALADETAVIAWSPLLAVELEYARRKRRRSFVGAAVALVEKVARAERWECLAFDDRSAAQIPYLFAAGLTDPFDIMIAATALAYDAALLTCDAVLGRVPTLRVVW
ncbi:MAG: PIN domain-containing protein [Verrucomicrobia bacterium]|nr:PIN domain-containing protein [Verrucomicrobiota bacterium]